MDTIIYWDQWLTSGANGDDDGNDGDGVIVQVLHKDSTHAVLHKTLSSCFLTILSGIGRRHSYSYLESVSSEDVSGPLSIHSRINIFRVAEALLGNVGVKYTVSKATWPAAVDTYRV